MANSVGNGRISLPASAGVGGLPAVPIPAQLRAAMGTATEAEIRAIARLLLTEGVPHAFHAMPVAYEYYREQIAHAAGVDEKNVTVVGSVRFGFSLTPSREKYGAAVTERSDLDAAVIGEKVFEDGQAAFLDWKQSLDEQARTKFDVTVAQVEREAARGFISLKLLPHWLPFVRRLHDPLWRVIAKWRTIRGAPRLNGDKSSVRVYRDWDAALAQTTLNLRQIRRV